MSFQATVRHNRDVAVIDLSGRLVLGEDSQTLRDAILGLILEGERKILLNLKDVTQVDSAGLGEMCAACTNVTNAGGEVRLVTPVRIHGQMEVTGLSNVFADYPDEGAAAESFRREPTKV
ncbi:MAG TPA: STAS domain-containing protein [Bryobacteraceae bacterium]|nr:STAS domain-containing protein [Bryobacteraceae bacterium]